MTTFEAINYKIIKNKLYIEIFTERSGEKWELSCSPTQKMQIEAYE